MSIFKKWNSEPSISCRFADIVASNPTCSDGIRLEPIETYNISDNGTLQTPSFSAPLLSYCLDYFIDKAKGNTDERSLVPILKAMICFDTKYDELDSKGLIVLPHGVAVVFGITMIISAICLAVAAVVRLYTRIEHFTCCLRDKLLSLVKFSDFMAIT